MANVLSILQQSALFGSLNAEDLAELAAHMTRQTIPNDLTLFEKGTLGDCLYLVDYGRVQIYLLDEHNQRVTLKIYGAGEVFGEYSLLDNAPRSAYAAALEHTELLVLHQRDFDAFLADHPGAGLALLRGLAQRIRYSSDYLRRVTDMIETMTHPPASDTPQPTRNTVGEMTLNVGEFEKLLKSIQKK